MWLASSLDAESPLGRWICHTHLHMLRGLWFPGPTGAVSGVAVAVGLLPGMDSSEGILTPVSEWCSTFLSAIFVCVQSLLASMCGPKACSLCVLPRAIPRRLSHLWLRTMDDVFCTGGCL